MYYKGWWSIFCLKLNIKMHTVLHPVTVHRRLIWSLCKFEKLKRNAVLSLSQRCSVYHTWQLYAGYSVAVDTVWMTFLIVDSAATASWSVATTLVQIDKSMNSWMKYIAQRRIFLKYAISDEIVLLLKLEIELSKVNPYTEITKYF